MTDEQLCAALRAAESQFRESQSATDESRAERNRLVRLALESGWTHARIAAETGLTRGRINQLRGG